MHTSRIWPIVIVCFAAYAAPLLANAQQPANPAPPPPQTQKLEEGEAPTITIRQPGADEQPITQTRKQGKVSEVKVNSGSSTYYLKSNEQAGSTLPGDTESSAMRGSQWQVLQFDLSKKKDPNSVESPDAPQLPASK